MRAGSNRSRAAPFPFASIQLSALKFSGIVPLIGDKAARILIGAASPEVVERLHRKE
jgi:hypothetical protein